MIATTEHLEVSTAPTFNGTHPVQLTELKQFLKETAGEIDSELKRMIEVVTLREQEELSIQIPEATYILYRDGFSDWMELRRPPVTDVASVKYLDADGATQTLSTSVYRTIQTDQRRKPAVVTRAYNQTWPITRGIERDVWITFTCGFAENSVPRDLQALVMHGVEEEFTGRDNQKVIGRIRNNLRWML